MSKNVIIIGGTGHLGISLGNYLIKKTSMFLLLLGKKKTN